MSIFIPPANLEKLSEQDLRKYFYEVFNAVARKQDELNSLKATLQRIQIELFDRANS